MILRLLNDYKIRYYTISGDESQRIKRLIEIIKIVSTNKYIKNNDLC